MIGPDSIHIVSTPVTLSAGTAAQLVAANFTRRLLTLQVTGTGAATFGFGHAPTAGAGLSLNAASSAGGEGGSYEVSNVGDSIWAISTAGTTVVVLEGY
jgi:hypothetical protein